MGSSSPHRKCRCCKDFLTADYRNAYHQLYCSKPECRRASKAASQRRWLAKPANRDYFRGRENMQRVQEWRRAHPGYWKKKSGPLPQTQPPEAQAVDLDRHLVTQPVQSSQSSGTLQDVCITKDPAFIGLISMLTASTLQEDIASTTRKLEARGRDILGLGVPGKSQTVYDCQTSPPA